MSFPPEPPESSNPDLSNLLRNIDERDLSEPDILAFLEQTNESEEYTEFIQEQQRVRALLSQVPAPKTPPNLLKRVQLALDEEDRQQALAASPSEAPAVSWRQRLWAMMRGGMVMAPAAAAAGLLWVSLRPDPAQPPVAASENITKTTSGTSEQISPVAAPPERLAAENPATLNADALPPSVPPPILNARSLPQDIEFVSAKPDVVRYRNARRNFQLIDRRQPVSAPRPSRAQLYQEGGQSFILSRNAQGHAHLDFRLGHHTHRLTLVPEQASAQPGAISAQHPHFVEMLRFARALQRAAQP